MYWYHVCQIGLQISLGFCLMKSLCYSNLVEYRHYQLWCGNILNNIEGAQFFYPSQQHLANYNHIQCHSRSDKNSLMKPMQLIKLSVVCCMRPWIRIVYNQGRWWFECLIQSRNDPIILDRNWREERYTFRCSTLSLSYYYINYQVAIAWDRLRLSVYILVRGNADGYKSRIWNFLEIIQELYMRHGCSIWA